MKNEIWALRIIQNWNQAQYVVGKQPLFTTQGEWPEENNNKKVVSIYHLLGETDGYKIAYDDGSDTFVSDTTEGIIIEEREDENETRD